MKKLLLLTVALLIIVVSSSYCQKKELKRAIRKGENKKGYYDVYFKHPKDISKIKKWCNERGYVIIDKKFDYYQKFGSIQTGASYVALMTKNDYNQLMEWRQEQAKIAYENQENDKSLLESAFEFVIEHPRETLLGTLVAITSVKSSSNKSSSSSYSSSSYSSSSSSSSSSTRDYEIISGRYNCTVIKHNSNYLTVYIYDGTAFSSDDDHYFVSYSNTYGTTKSTTDSYKDGLTDVWRFLDQSDLPVTTIINYRAKGSSKNKSIKIKFNNVGEYYIYIH